MSDIDSPPVTSPPKAKKMRRSFTYAKKLEIIKYVEGNNSKSVAVTKFGIDRFGAGRREWLFERQFYYRS